jgi:hypothetical protein
MISARGNLRDVRRRTRDFVQLKLFCAPRAERSVRDQGQAVPRSGSDCDDICQILRNVSLTFFAQSPGANHSVREKSETVVRASRDRENVPKIAGHIGLTFARTTPRSDRPVQPQPERVLPPT